MFPCLLDVRLVDVDSPLSSVGADAVLRPHIVYVNSLVATLCARNKIRNVGLNTTYYFTTPLVYSDQDVAPRTPSNLHFTVPRATVVSLNISVGDTEGGASSHGIEDEFSAVDSVSSDKRKHCPDAKEHGTLG